MSEVVFWEDGAEAVEIRSAYGPRMRLSLTFDGPEGVSMAKQSMRDETDINNILRRYVKSGSLTHLAQNPGQFADVSEIGDYRSALEQVRSAEATFMNLPARVRTRFNNDAAEFLDFVTTPGNEDELKSLGLWAEGKAPEPVKGGGRYGRNGPVASGRWVGA